MPEVFLNMTLYRSLASAGVLLLAVGGWNGLSAQDACPVPVAWHLTEVDERFGITQVEAADAIRQAGMLWSTAVGNPFLFPESVEGMAIRFIYDHRQEQVLARRGRQTELDAQARTVSQAQDDLARLRLELDRQREVREVLGQDYEERWDAHQRIVDDWNQRGGAPPAEVARLTAAVDVLERERDALMTRDQALNALVDRVNAETARVNGMIEDLNRASADSQSGALASAEPPAEYREIRRTFGPFEVSRTRQLDVFQFESWDHLVLVLARQLGYALGLETSEVPGAVMSLSPRRGAGEGPPRLDPSDEAQARELCVESRG